jgi:class 3 adenylate cyclase
MKRLTYISRFPGSLSQKAIQAIGEVSRRNNARDEITGVLLSCKTIFFQILEGDEEKIDHLYEKILRDKRHYDILCLKAELDIPYRSFPEWSMELIILDERSDLLLQPIKMLLETLTESQTILSQYTQPSLLANIAKGVNPLYLAPRYIEKIVLFADVKSFSSLTQQLPVHAVVDLLNHFFTIANNAIAAHGGEVTKFIGDCVMAYFNGDQADAAVSASLQIQREMHNLRSSAAKESHLRLVHNGIGIAKGIVLEGNIGSHLKKDYTIIGDTVNMAARIESVTRQLEHNILFSESVAQSLTQWQPICVGAFLPKGYDGRCCIKRGLEGKIR